MTSQVSHPYRSTDFTTQALNILILVSFEGIVCCVIGLVPGIQKDYRALIFWDIRSVLALLDPEDEGPLFHCNVRDYRDCTRKDIGTSRKTQIFATLIESHQGREHKFFKRLSCKRCLPSGCHTKT